MLNIEIKGSLARLLATENLLIEHKQVPTASFDVDKRVLTLPMWTKASETVYNLLVGHEVGHALFTPNEELDTIKAPKSFVNVTEDARIEKLMKRKYPGLAKDFYGGYQELDADDFFSIRDEDLEFLPLIDRVNLHFKIGAYSMMPFTPSETPLRDAVGDAETFQEACDAALAIYLFMKKEAEENPAPKMPTSNQSQSGGGEQVDSDPNEGQGREWFDDESEGRGKDDPADLETPSYEENNNQDEEEEGSGTEVEKNQPYGEPSIDDVRTQRSFDHQAEGLSSTHDCQVTYATFPKIDQKQVVVDAKIVWQDAVSDWANQYPVADYPTPFDDVDAKFNLWSTDTAKDVNYLVKEFECRKSASSHARATTSRTGVLDMGKLHTYKYNEDIFKKVTRLPEGKNHGLVFLLDWSGSMCDDLFDTVKQVINLCQFCNKVGIPFDVYSFVIDAGMSYLNGDTPGDEAKPVSSNNVGELYVENRFKLVNLLTSDVNKKTFNEHCKYLFRVANYYGSRYQSYGFEFTPRPPRFMGLGGTPLNEALVVMESLLGSWQQRKGVEKTHLLILTDGESQSLAITREGYQGKNVPNYYGLNNLVIRRNGRYYPAITDNQMEATLRLIQILRETYPDSSILGFRICKTRSLTYYLHQLGMTDYHKREQILKGFKKNKSCVITDSAYSELYVLNGGVTETTAMDTPEEATKAQIKSAFVKSLKSKGVNRKMLSSFVGQIA